MEVVLGLGLVGEIGVLKEDEVIFDNILGYEKLKLDDEDQEVDELEVCGKDGVEVETRLIEGAVEE